MDMVFELNEADVIEIIAKHFVVDQDKVKCNIYMETKGYGLGEHQEPSLKVIVRK